MAINLSRLPTWWAGLFNINPSNIEAATVNGVGGGIPVMFLVTVPDAATGDVDVGTMTFAWRLTDVTVIKTGAAGGAANSVQVKKGASAISDLISTNIADQAVARAATLDDANWSFAIGDTLRVSRIKAGGNAACTVRVLGVRV
jgi:hypothetical protein